MPGALPCAEFASDFAYPRHTATLASRRTHSRAKNSSRMIQFVTKHSRIFVCVYLYICIYCFPSRSGDLDRYRVGFCESRRVSAASARIARPWVITAGPSISGQRPATTTLIINARTDFPTEKPPFFDTYVRRHTGYKSA